MKSKDFTITNEKTTNSEFKKQNQIFNISKDWLLSKLPEDKKFTDGFEPIEVNLPHHWQNEYKYKNHTGKVIYKKKINMEFDFNSRYFLHFEGIFYYHEVYINGIPIGTGTGYFAPHTYEIPKSLFSENITVFIIVESNDETNLRSKNYITGIFGHWDAREPFFNSGGIWKNVSIIKTGNTKIINSLISADLPKISKDTSNAKVNLNLNLNSNAKNTVKIKIKFKPENFTGTSFSFEKQFETQPNINYFQLIDLNLENVKLWYPFNLGFPHVYRVEIAILINNKISDSHNFTFGFRKITWNNWKFKINNQKFYAKGINVAPLKYRMANVNPDDWEREFKILKKLNCNMIRVHCHVQIKKFYELADKYGITIFQDFPLQWMYSRSVEQTAIHQIKQMTLLLYNHPSIVIWSCHNEPYFVGNPLNLDKTNFFYIWEFIVYNYDKVILDRKLKRAVKKIDKTRFVNRASCIYSIIGLPGTDIHAYWGWYFSKMTLFNIIRRIAKRNLKFVSEFGAQSIPCRNNAIKFMDEDLELVDWDYLRTHHNCQTKLMHRYVPLKKGDDLGTYIRATQKYQSKFLQYYIDVCRLVKNKPNGGMLAFMYKSCHPGIDWSVIDYWGKQKNAAAIIRRGFQDIYPFVFINSNNTLRHNKNTVKFFVVNDKTEKIDNAKLTIRVKINNKVHFEDIINVNTPASSGAVKVKSVKLKNVENNTKIKILLILENNGNIYKNKYNYIV